MKNYPLMKNNLLMKSMGKHWIFIYCCLLPLVVSVAQSQASEAWTFTGDINLRADYQTQSALLTEQGGSSASMALTPELYKEWDDGYQSFTFKPFIRIDNQYNKKSHADIRELSWLKIADDWELQLGISSVFWGVTESLHLVDVINQADVQENLDGTVKLGQPMLRLAWINDWGSTSLFVLPGFRERELGDKKSRLRAIYPLGITQYLSSAGKQHTDLALRWESSIGDVDIGLSHFYGTSRNPSLRPSLDTNNNLSLNVYYDLIHQSGLDLQLTRDAWLWKLEMTYQQPSQTENVLAAIGGFEYSFYGVFQSDTDVGVLLEYQYNNASQIVSAANNDLFIGFRFALNDVASSELLVGSIVDLDHHASIFSVKGSRRFGNSWKVSLEGRWFNHIPESDPLFSIQKDDFVRLEASWYF